MERVDLRRTRLSGWTLILARAGWMAVFLLEVSLFVIAVPFRMEELRQDPYHLTPALNQFGLSIDFFVLYSTLLEGTLAVTLISIALIIFWRKSDDWMGLLVSIGQVNMIVVLPVIMVLPQVNDAWRLPVLSIRSFGLSLVILVFYLFPDGSFKPRWARWLFLLFLGCSLVSLFVPNYTPPAAPIDIQNLVDALTVLAMLAWVGSGALLQVYRFLICSDPVQRQQTKWVVFGFSMVFLGLVLISLPVLLFPSLRSPGIPNLLYLLIDIPLTISGLAVLPIMIGVSILKYRLWDIDILIRRTLLYSLLTAMLVLVYLSSIVLLQAIFQILTGQGTSPIVTILSTLAIAALFNPLRFHIQDFIDRRFYRSKYDTSQALNSFAQTARNEVEMNSLTTTLLEVIVDAMHPENVSLWLKNPNEVKK